MNKIKVGIIGCGNISSIYIKNLSDVFEITEVVACADLDIEKAKAKAEEFNIPVYCSVDRLLAMPEISVVVNLTGPCAHADICIAALNANKHVYVEKPLAVTLEDGRNILNKAEETGLLVGCAPDTFLGASLQLSRKLIDDGWIGTPVAATAFMMAHGPEDWHPNPDFFYKTGGGPLFDMGPYYLTALVSMLGPIERVSGTTKTSFSERVIRNPSARYGETIPAEVPTHISANLNFHTGVLATLITSFDVWATNVPRIEIYGTEGTLNIPDPNHFHGPALIKRRREPEWQEIHPVHSYTDNSRGIGVADLAHALSSGRTHRASAQMGYHILETMHAVINSAEDGECKTLTSSCERPRILPFDLLHGRLDG